MQLSVREVARLLKVSENTVYRLVDERSLPAQQINSQYFFNKAELLEWATAQRIKTIMNNTGAYDRRPLHHFVNTHLLGWWPLRSLGTLL